MDAQQILMRCRAGRPPKSANEIFEVVSQNFPSAYYRGAKRDPDQEFSIKGVIIDKYSDTVGLPDDVDKDFSDLWKKVSEFVSLPEDLPVGTPLSDPERVAQSVQ
jgi:hypothetical protein